MRGKRATALALGGLLLAGVGCTKTDTTTTGPTSAPTTAAGDSTTTRAEVGSGLGAVAPAASKEYMKQSAERTTEVTTGEFLLTVSVADNPVLGDGEQTLLGMQGSFDRDATRSQMDLDLAGVVAVAPEALGSTDPTELTLIKRIFAEPVTVLYDGSDQYLKSAPLSKLVGKDKPWLRSTSSEGLTSQFGMFKLDDVSSFLDTLSGAGEVEEVGKEKVQGVTATHYHVDVDLSKLDKAEAGSLLSDLGSTGTAVVDVWIDDQGLVRKLRLESGVDLLDSIIKQPVEGSGAAITIEFAALGEPVDIEVPDPSDVAELSNRTESSSTTTEGKTTTTVKKRTTTTTAG